MTQHEIHTSTIKPDPVLDALDGHPAEHLANAFLVGAMKSGTSWLAKQMENHPDVFVPGIKEPNLLVSPNGEGFPLKGPLPEDQLHHAMHRFSSRTVAEYAALYAPASDCVVRLDASIRYLTSDLAADRLVRLFRENNLRPRILVLLRDPVARTWSHWQMHRTMGIEPLAFHQALAAEEQRLADGWNEDWGYILHSRYEQHLLRYFERFGKTNVHIEIYEEAVANPDAAMARIYDFLGIDPQRAAKGTPQKRVRVQKRTGSSEIEQIARYYRPSWRNLVPRPVRHSVWKGLETLNARTGQRRLKEADAVRVRALLAQTQQNCEEIIGRTLPWNAEQRS